MSTLVVAGALASKPGNGGEAWVRMTWLRGLARLGFDVWFVEQVDAASAHPSSGEWFRTVTRWFGVHDRSVLVRTDSDGSWSVVSEAGRDIDLGDLLGTSSLLVNISGNLRHPDLLALVERPVYVDLDPGFTQIWAASGEAGLALDAHHLHFTVGEHIGSPRCPLPTGGHRWLPCRQPVLLDDWPLTPPDHRAPFSSVATWRCPFGPVAWDGTTYGLKLHEFRKVITLPETAAAALELALAIDPDDDADRRRLLQHGWRVRPAADVAASPAAFRDYVQSSAGEFAVAQGVYTATTGWFSDRTTRYLASGRPAIVQDTGWATDFAIDEGLITFRGLDDARDAIGAVATDLELHSKAARRVAEEYFSSERVLARFLELSMP